MARRSLMAGYGQTDPMGGPKPGGPMGGMPPKRQLPPDAGTMGLPASAAMPKQPAPSLTGNPTAAINPDNLQALMGDPAMMQMMQMLGRK